MNTKELGSIGELKFSSEAIKKGYHVFKEVGDNSEVDLILLKDKHTIKKVQVKTTEKIQDNGTMYWTIFKSRQNHSRSKKEFYDDGIDGFGLYCLENDYIGYIPKNECNSQYGITLRIDTPKNNQSKKVMFAKDYIF